MDSSSSSSSSSPLRTDPLTPLLLSALYTAARKGPENPKPLVRNTVHRVPVRAGDNDLPSSSSSSSKSCFHYTVRSWKTSEFAYRKAETFGVGEAEGNVAAAADSGSKAGGSRVRDLPTLARGLFTVETGDGPGEERIAVRGYDKFFNVGEMAWTKPPSIERYSAPPYLLTFKENGCIIFISALSPSQIIVTSKHSLDSQQQNKGDGAIAASEAGPVEEDEIGGEETNGSSSKVSHAAKGEEWLERHLGRVGRTKQQLAAELWRRGETAVAELCDDSFEEHVLAYPPEKSGLHLHGLNANAVAFQTRPMEEVELFAIEWGMMPTRYITLGSLKEVTEFTDRVGTTGEWQGEAIEGFVVRTTMPREAAAKGQTAVEGAVSPPYAPGQAWFYKVKFDEPYLMYRDWRELTKKMLAEKKKWEQAKRSLGSSETGPDDLAEQVGDLQVESTASTTPGEKKSKNQLKKENKARKAAEARRNAASKGTVPLPSPPKPRSNRPETRLFIQWCFERMYGSEDGRVRPNMAIFSGINVGKGIIRLRDMFLAYLDTPEGRGKLGSMGGARGVLAARLGEQTAVGNKEEQEAAAKAEQARERASRPFTHLLVVPIAVPGCGKTSLFVALEHLYPSLVAHTQSDDVTSKKTAPTFLKNICAELKKKPVVLADRNNHLLKHRDEIVETVRGWEDRGGKTEEEAKAEEKANKKKQQQQKSKPTQKSQQQGQEDKGQGAAQRGQPGLVDPPTDTAAPSSKPRTKIVALAWSLDLLPLNALHRIMSDRILLRGDNHQSLVADTTSATGSRSHETILWRFLESLETLGSAEGKGEGFKGMGDAELDEVVKLDVEMDHEAQLRRVCQELSRLAPPGLELPVPTEEQMQEALAVAARYRVKVKKVSDAEPAQSGKGGKGKDAPKPPRYYGIAVEVDLASLIPRFLNAAAAAPGTSRATLERAREIFASLRENHRITARPHITLVHSAALKSVPPADGGALSDEQQRERTGAQERWDTYAALTGAAAHPNAAQGGSSTASAGLDFEVELGHLVFDEDVMAFSIAVVSPCGASETADQGTDAGAGAGAGADASAPALTPEVFWALQGGKGGRSTGYWRPHITVGTRDESIRPYEANRVMREAEKSAGDAWDEEATGSAAGATPGKRRKEVGLVRVEGQERGALGGTLRCMGRLMGMSG